MSGVGSMSSTLKIVLNIALLYLFHLHIRLVVQGLSYNLRKLVLLFCVAELTRTSLRVCCKRAIPSSVGSLRLA